MLKRLLAAIAFCAATSTIGFGASAETRALKLYHTHTHKSATIIYKRDGRFDTAGLAKLNAFLADWRNGKPTKMDPKLFDIVWEVYQRSGATRPINIVSSYRSPETNAMLRRRSSGVAENSLHTKGMAMDFFIPGVPLAKLRALGLQAQAGGVGYYPKSGSPFVHMDTGNVRHWPRMSRSELVAVFPKGGTLHVPSDGKQLPGYSQALAAYKARQARGILVSWAAGRSGPETGDDIQIEVVEADSSIDIAAADMPLPRLAPDRDDDDAPAADADSVGITIAMADTDPGLRSTGAPLLSYPAQVDRVIGPGNFGDLEGLIQSEIDFDEAITAPAVPADLADAMAARDTTVRPDVAATSIPIQPTAIVETVDIGVDLSRTLRADAVTAAVFRDTEGGAAPPVMAYAAAASPVPGDDGSDAAVGTAEVPIPQPNPLRTTASALAEPALPSAPLRAYTADEVYGRLPSAALTLTKLDTQGLRIWIADQSTREKRYAVFTMPAFAETPALLDKPEVTFAARFDTVVYRGMRTDHFAGSSTQPPAVVDLVTSEIIAAR